MEIPAGDKSLKVQIFLHKHYHSLPVYIDVMQRVFMIIMTRILELLVLLCLPYNHEYALVIEYSLT